ncbi:hypothetical protein GHT06_010211 [Daphnia sinensis]|uniref:Uncharacterized protein n=1 Tax=Daphnia sinensis TaxID=1820382 RepID=A0AAD5PX91_9CRUS|nr:hypothetical protein GHT06_010211 [Daphnia sinensis]
MIMNMLVENREASKKGGGNRKRRKKEEVDSRSPTSSKMPHLFGVPSCTEMLLKKSPFGKRMRFKHEKEMRPARGHRNEFKKKRIKIKKEYRLCW